VLELGWAVRDARTGRGCATELGRAALAWARAHQPWGTHPGPDRPAPGRPFALYRRFS